MHMCGCARVHGCVWVHVCGCAHVCLCVWVHGCLHALQAACRVPVLLSGDLLGPSVSAGASLPIPAAQHLPARLRLPVKI